MRERERERERKCEWDSGAPKLLPQIKVILHREPVRVRVKFLPRPKAMQMNSNRGGLPEFKADTCNVANMPGLLQRQSVIVTLLKITEGVTITTDCYSTGYPCETSVSH